MLLSFDYITDDEDVRRCYLHRPASSSSFIFTISPDGGAAVKRDRIVAMREEFIYMMFTSRHYAERGICRQAKIASGRLARIAKAFAAAPPPRQAQVKQQAERKRAACLTGRCLWQIDFFFRHAFEGKRYYLNVDITVIGIYRLLS